MLCRNKWFSSLLNTLTTVLADPGPGLAYIREHTVNTPSRWIEKKCVFIFSSHTQSGQSDHLQLRALGGMMLRICYLLSDSNMLLLFLYVCTVFFWTSIFPGVLKKFVVIIFSFIKVGNRKNNWGHTSHMCYKQRYQNYWVSTFKDPTYKYNLSS